MKKIIVKATIFIIIGFMIGEFVFNHKKEYFQKLKNNETYYFLQEGVYSNEELLKNNLNKLSQKVIDHKENKYYVYVGITKDKEVAEKLTNIYKNNGYTIYQKEKNIQSEEFAINVNQFDFLIKETSDTDQILTIEKVVLANYEEIMKKQ